MNEYLVIVPDDCPPDPRKEFETFAHMVCWHRRYNLGDPHHFATPSDFEEWTDEHEDEIIAIASLYIMDHSGLAIRMGEGFSDVDPVGWDWGQVGWIYVTYEDLERAGFKPKAREEAIRHAYEVMRTEVQMYNQYITGDVYVIQKYSVCEHGREQLDDAIGGFFGYDAAVEGAREHFPGVPILEEDDV